MDALTDALASVALHTLGVRRDAIADGRLERLARELDAAHGASAFTRVAAADDALVAALARAVAVAETYFFRQPEHFAFVVHEVAPRARSRPLRAWVAGCATGEEAYSLAAALHAAGLEDATVLGTDVSEEGLAVARTGRYPRRAMRSTPPWYVADLEAPGDEFAVDATIGARVRFARHNLLDAPPEGPFDLVLCRNVLVYFSAPARQLARDNLASALAPGGVLLFSPMDVDAPPPGVVRVGPPELQAFEHAAPRRRSTAPPRRRASVKPPRPRVAAEGDDPVRRHVEALELVDRGERRRAARLLDDLRARHPSYVAGLVERALLHDRDGERRAAVALMRTALVEIGALDPEALVVGPEPRPARFWEASIRAYLERRGGGA